MTQMAMSKLGGFPLGVVQVFAPIRLRNVPDCSRSHRSLGCRASASPLEEGLSRIRGTVRPEQVNILDIACAWRCLAGNARFWR